MQHSRFTEQQIAFVLDQVARGAPVERTCRAAGIPLPTFYRWRAKYAGMKPSEIRRLHEIEDENKRLKRMLASLLVVKATPKDAPLQLPAPRPAIPLPAPAPAVATNRYWQSLAEFLPKPETLNVRGQTRAVMKRAHDWGATHIKQVRGGSVRALAGGARARLRNIWRTRKLLLISFAGGLVGGFAIGLAPTATNDGPKTVPVNLQLRANSYGVLSSGMSKGWGGGQPWGRWMEGGKASVLLGFDGPARGDVELLVEARTRMAKGQPEETLIVRFNEAELSRWQLPSESGPVRRRFIVPHDVFNQNTAAKLTFELAGRAPLSPVFGLEAVSLRDARFLHDYRGFVDQCTTEALVGWAMAEGVPVTVSASIDGKPVDASQINVERPDLAANKLPKDAGFKLKFAKPVVKGTAIDVHFANGRPLSGSPCKP